MLRSLFAVSLLTISACGPEYVLPDQGPTEISAAAPELAALVVDAAEDWSRSGLELARFVTVNQDAHGFPVRLVPRAKLGRFCRYTDERSARADVSSFDGCTMFFSTDRNERGIFIADDLHPERLAVVIKHELIHVLLPNAPHVESDVAAVFHTNGTSVDVTQADVDHLSRFARFTAD